MKVLCFTALGRCRHDQALCPAIAIKSSGQVLCFKSQLLFQWQISCTFGPNCPKLADQGQTARYYPTGRSGPDWPKYCFRYVKYNVINTNCSLSHGFVMVQKLKCRKIQDFRHVNSLRSVAIGFLGAAIGPLIARSDCDRCDQCDRRTAIGSVKLHDVCVGRLRSDFAIRLCDRTAI